MHGVAEVDVARAVGLEAHRDAGVRLLHGREVIVAGLDDFVAVIEQEVHLRVASAHQGQGRLLVLLLILLEDGLVEDASLGVEGEAGHVVLDGHLPVRAVQGLAEEGGRVPLGQSLVLQGGFLPGLEFGLALLHLGDGVVVVLLGFQLFLAGTAQDAEPHQQHADEDQPDNGVFIHWVVCFIRCVLYI